MTVIESQDGNMIPIAENVGMFGMTGTDETGCEVICEISGNQYTLGNYATRDAAGYVLGEIKAHVSRNENYKLPRDENGGEYDY